MTPIVDLDTNRSVNPEISISNVQSQGHVSVDKWIGAQHDCKSSGNFHRVNSGTGDQRQEPVGKVSKPRHNEMLEENSQITEPKRVVSTGKIQAFLYIQTDITYLSFLHSFVLNNTSLFFNCVDSE